jgi:hypothetical protein
MVQLFAGQDGTGVACVKILKNNGDNPLAVSDTDYSRFYFNSKWETNVRFVGTDRLNFVDDGVEQYFPAGTNKNNFERAVTGSVSFSTYFWSSRYWQNNFAIDYDLPVFDVKEVDNSGVYTYCRIGVGSSGYQGRTQTYSHANAMESGYIVNWLAGANWPINVRVPLCLVSFGQSGQNKRAVIWNLPGDETAIKDPPLTPVPGQLNLQIDSAGFRVSKPGYDVRAATRTQLAFDSAVRPVKIVAAGDIAVPTGTTSWDFSANLAGIPVTGELVADVIQYKGSTISFPCSLPVDGDDYGANFYFSGNSLVFVNPGSAVRARILIIAQDNSAPSAGPNDVFRQDTIGGQPVFQILRPGAANPPTLADIIIDSRWPCLQIIKTGVFSIPGGGGERITDVPFNSAGLFPFVKYFTIHPAGEPNSSPAGASDSNATGKRIRLPYASQAMYTVPGDNPVGYVPGDCTYCELSTNLARFHTFRGNPYRINVESDGSTDTESVTCEAYAIRYYIFGIPN